MLFEYLDALRTDYNNLSKIHFLKRLQIKSSVNNLIASMDDVPITSTTFICSFINLMYNNQELQIDNLKCSKRYYDGINTASILYIHDNDDCLDIEFVNNLVSNTTSITFKPNIMTSSRTVVIKGTDLDNSDPLIYNTISIIRYYMINYLVKYKSVYFK